MDTFLASFGILGWGVAIATAVYFNAETKRLASELRVAVLRIGALKELTANYERALASAGRPKYEAGPVTAMRREIRGGYQPARGAVPNPPSSGSGVKPAVITSSEPDNLLPGIIIGMSLQQSSESIKADEPSESAPSCDAGSSDSGSSGGGN